MFLLILRRLNPEIVLLSLLIIFGFVLRIYDLGYQSLWYDEGYSINAALCMLERGLPILPSEHFYSGGILNTGLIASSVGLFGTSEFSARLPSVIFGVLTIPLAFFFAKRTGDKMIALITAFLVTFSILEIAWSRQARMYQQLQFFYILSLFIFYEFIRNGKNRYLILTFISTICTILSHVFGLSLILVYVTFLLATNIKNTKKYLDKALFLNKKFIIFAVSTVVLLIIGEIIFGVFSTVLNARVNYFGEYTDYLKQNFPVIVYLAPVGAIIFLRKEYRPSLLLILAVIIPFYFICFHVKLLGFRYLYLILPLFFIFFSYTITYLSTLVPRGKFKPILRSIIVVVLLGLTVYSSGFNFTPQNVYYLEPMAPQPDFKRAYSFINQNVRAGDIVIDTWPAVGSFYLRRAPDYWLAFDIAGLKQDYFIGEDKSRELYTNALCIKNLEMLAGVLDENPSGWLIIDGLARFRLPSNIIEFIKQNMTYYEQGSSRNRAGDVWVYGWSR
jgi:4-amino-4-deoxy-L-arabinose transferase-like glycosyltransferase